MKKNGFTLVELIVTITLFGIMMLASVPNVTSMVDKNKRTSYVTDAKKMIRLARYQFYTEYQEEKPSSGTCKKYNINDLDRSDLQKGPYGGNYDGNYSFVTVTYKNNQYVFSAQLVERYLSGGQKFRGVKLSSLEELDKENAKIKCVSAPLSLEQAQSYFRHENSINENSSC